MSEADEGGPVGYTLTVDGDCEPEQEHELSDALARLLSDPKYGVTGSQLFGRDVNGPVHYAPKPVRKGKDDAGLGDS